MAEQDSDRSEEATPYKLQEARKKGSVAKSPDFTATAILAGLVLAIYGSGWDSMRKTMLLQQKTLAQISKSSWQPDQIAIWLGDIMLGMLSILGPLFLTLLVLAVLGNLFQTGGVVLSFHPVKPDFERLNPVNGFKKIFSMRTLFDAAKSCLKLAILGTVTYVLVKDLIPGLIALSLLEPKSYVKILLALGGSLIVKLVLLVLINAMLDFAFARWEFSKRMRMSKRDIKDEVKNREGDPRIRSRIRALRKEMLKRTQSMAKLPSADVLIVNPTHIAVALSYKHGESAAPKVVAKGGGELARKMREIAHQHRIPVVQNRSLARTLYRQVDSDSYVPEKFYPQIAKIMVWAYAMRNPKRQLSKG